MGRVGTLNAPLSAVLIKPSTCAMCILTESDYPRNHFTMSGCPISYSWLSTTRSKLPWSSDPFHSSGLDTRGLDHRGIGFPAASLSVPIEVTWHPLMASPFNPVGCTGWQTGADRIRKDRVERMISWPQWCGHHAMSGKQTCVFCRSPESLKDFIHTYYVGQIFCSATLRRLKMWKCLLLARNVWVFTSCTCGG